jgi:hypothetical protein
VVADEAADAASHTEATKAKAVDLFGRPLLDALVVDGVRKYDVPPIMTRIAEEIERRGVLLRIARTACDAPVRLSDHRAGLAA